MQCIGYSEDLKKMLVPKRKTAESGKTGRATKKRRIWRVRYVHIGCLGLNWLFDPLLSPLLSRSYSRTLDDALATDRWTLSCKTSYASLCSLDITVEGIHFAERTRFASSVCRQQAVKFLCYDPYNYEYSFWTNFAIVWSWMFDVPS